MFLGIDSRGLAFTASDSDVRSLVASQSMQTPFTNVVCVPFQRATGGVNHTVSAFLGEEFRGEAIFCALVNGRLCSLNEVVLEKLGWAIARAVISLETDALSTSRHLGIA